jgi:hypothetical protein
MTPYLLVIQINILVWVLLHLTIFSKIPVNNFRRKNKINEFSRRNLKVPEK